MPIRCPICPSTNTEQILSQYKVTVHKVNDSEVGALATYRCRKGHIFFVRLADLMWPEVASDASYLQQFGNQ